MGLLYILDGNPALSMLGSMFIVVCYYFAVQQLKKNKEVMYKNNFLHLSSIFWLFFLILGIISFNLMSHFINVEFNCKETIKKEATAKINLVDSIAKEYKRRAKEDIQTFESELKTKLGDYKANPSNSKRNALMSAPYNLNFTVVANPEGINIIEVANAKVSPFQIKIDNNIKNIDKTLSINNKNYQSVFDNWKRLSIVGTYSKLNQYVEDNIQSINTKIAELPLNKSEIKPIFDKKQLPLNSPSKLNVQYPPNYLIPIFFILLTHLFILIPFLTWKIPDYGSEKTIDPLEIENVREI